jgi:hypothetical protein
MIAARAAVRAVLGAPLPQPRPGPFVQFGLGTD